ncbi:hypothetical protein ACQP2T_44485 [Nonomuraea sp. CA-143628]|uniref:hypothetical protein n=1 Tax=Nonomuraea sp. CA-143628 TaxID=3239997 RepID=UPI003D8FB881
MRVSRARVRASCTRADGFTEGRLESGIALDGRFLLETEFTRVGGYEAARELAGRGLEGTEVVFAVNDVMATGVMRPPPRRGGAGRAQSSRGPRAQVPCGSRRG